MNGPRPRTWWGLSLVLLVWGGPAPGQGRPQRVKLPEVEECRPFLRWERPLYRNYGFQRYANYSNHTFPYAADLPQALYDSFGNYLLTGFDLYSWTERRTPGLEYGSAIFKDIFWKTVYDDLVLVRDGYGR